MSDDAIFTKIRELVAQNPAVAASLVAEGRLTASTKDNPSARLLLELVQEQERRER